MEAGDTKESEQNEREATRARILTIPAAQWRYYSATLSLGEVAQGLEAEAGEEQFSLGASLVLGQPAEYFVHVYREEGSQPQIIITGTDAQALVAEVFAHHIAADSATDNVCSEQSSHGNTRKNKEKQP